MYTQKLMEDCQFNLAHRVVRLWCDVDVISSERFQQHTGICCSVFTVA